MKHIRGPDTAPQKNRNGRGHEDKGSSERNCEAKTVRMLSHATDVTVRSACDNLALASGYHPPLEAS